MNILEPSVRAIDDSDPVPGDGPLVRLEAPAGGPVWVVTSPELGRQVLTDPRFAKDPALAPPGWDRRTAGLEPTAAEQISLTTLDGEPHAALRKAFVPLFSAKAMDAAGERIREIAASLLAGLDGEVDLMADFSTRYPLTVLCELFAVPHDLVLEAMTACRLMRVDYPAHVGESMGGFGRLAAAALSSPGSLVSELADRMPAGSTRRDLEYQVFTLLYAGQLTTDPAVGFLVARLLALPSSAPTIVDDTLTRHPPAPVSLWRFTTTELELAGVTLPARTPVLVDLRSGSTDLVFGAGAHYCIGARLARLELQALADALAAFPRARLLVPYEDLRQANPGGILGSRLVTLPVALA